MNPKTLVALTATVSNNENGIPLPQVINVIDGLVFGLLNENHLNQLKACITDVKSFAGDV